jgi:hypothetical protein
MNSIPSWGSQLEGSFLEKDSIPRKSKELCSNVSRLERRDTRIADDGSRFLSIACPTFAGNARNGFPLDGQVNINKDEITRRM